MAPGGEPISRLSVQHKATALTCGGDDRRYMKRSKVTPCRRQWRQDVFVYCNALLISEDIRDDDRFDQDKAEDRLNETDIEAS